jgi:predicted phage baseplate assembly protein
MSSTNCTCGCCQGREIVTPEDVSNRPGLSELRYRAGTHASFHETMLARLSALQYPELLGLTTRQTGDFAIALLDAWAIIADILTFYQERIANEGYLGTARERRSVLELARLIGYALRPGVASSVYLAYTLDKQSSLTLDKGNRARTIPGPGETPQSFETSDPLRASVEWNSLKARPSRPQRVNPSNASGIEKLYLRGTATRLRAGDLLLLDFGVQQTLRRVLAVNPHNEEQFTEVLLQLSPTTTTRLLPNRQPILSGDSVRKLTEQYRTLPASVRVGRKIQDMLSILDQIEDQLRPGMTSPEIIVLLENFRLKIKEARAQIDANLRSNAAKEWASNLEQALEAAAGYPAGPAGGTGAVNGNRHGIVTLDELLVPLAKHPSIPPVSQFALGRDITKAFGVPNQSPQATEGTRSTTDTQAQSISALWPGIGRELYTAWGNTSVVATQPVKIHALRVVASLFGYNVPKIPTYDNSNPKQLKGPDQWDEWGVAIDEKSNVLFLDNVYNQLLPDNYIAIQEPSGTPQVYKATDTTIRPRTAYGISAKTTQITIAENWWNPTAGSQQDFGIIRGTSIYTQAQGEELELADEPIDPVQEPVKGDRIELDSLYGGLEAGRWLIVTGERTDVPGATGVPASELVMLADVQQQVDSSLTGDSPHTVLVLANSLAYQYKLDTASVYGNVVKATHGETRSEVLGSGNASKSLQPFALRQPPLTYLPALTPQGATSTLEVRVNDVLWHETDSLDTAKPVSRVYITLTDNNAKTQVVFGNGVKGTRPPTGVENLKATYRSGIGKVGNARAGQISQLATRPLGVKGVTNPLAATGGTDPESRDQARRNAPLAIMSLDRLVSVQDYQDFARTYAGIGKASATRLVHGRRQIVHLTIAGESDIPIDPTSDLYRNLRLAIQNSGDPHQAFIVDMCQRLLLVLQGHVRVLPDYKWDAVAPIIRTALLDTFAFERQELGQSIALSKVISVMQAVQGVDYVDIDVFGSIPDSNSKTCRQEPPGAEEIAAQISQLAQEAEQNGPRQGVRVQLAQTVSGQICPSQLAFLTPDVPDTVILTEITS